MAENKRGEVLQRALEACILGKTDALPEFFTPDVSVWSPNMLATSLDELTEAVGDREGAFSDVTIQIDALDIVGNKGYAEYQLGATFSGAVRDRRRKQHRAERTGDRGRGRSRSRLRRRQDLGGTELLRRPHVDGAAVPCRIAARTTRAVDARRIPSLSRIPRMPRTWRCSRSRIEARLPPLPASATSRSSASSSATTTAQLVPGISGLVWGNSCELQAMWVHEALRGRGLACARDGRGGRGPAAGMRLMVFHAYDVLARGPYDRHRLRDRRRHRGLTRQPPAATGKELRHAFPARLE